MIFLNLTLQNDNASLHSNTSLTSFFSCQLSQKVIFMTKRQFTFLIEVKEGKNLLQKRSWYCHQLLQLTVILLLYVRYYGTVTSILIYTEKSYNCILLTIIPFYAILTYKSNGMGEI